MQIKTVPLGKKTTNKPKPQLISVSLLLMPSFQAPPPARPGRRGSLTPNPELGFPHSHPELRLALLHPTARPSRGPHGQTEPVGPSPPLTGARHRRLHPNGRGHAPPLAPPLAPQVPPPPPRRGGAGCYGRWREAAHAPLGGRDKMAAPVEVCHVACCANRAGGGAVSWGRGGVLAFGSCRDVVLYEPAVS